MKILMIILSTTILSIGTHCRAQTWDEWFNQKKTQKKYLLKQIVALQVYLDYVKNGYDIAQQGLTIIGDIKDGNFNLHKGYFESLEQVNPAIRNFDKVDFIKTLHRMTLKDIQTLHEDCARDENFTVDEISYITNVCYNIRDESNAIASDLISVTTSNELQMKDDERLRRIDKIFAETKDIFVFARSFGNSTRLLSLQRSKEITGINAVRKVHNVQPSKI